MCMNLTKLLFCLSFLLMANLYAIDRISGFSFPSVRSYSTMNANRNAPARQQSTPRQNCFSATFSGISIYNQRGTGDSFTRNYMPIPPPSLPPPMPSLPSASDAAKLNEAQMRQIAEKEKRAIAERQKWELEQKVRQQQEEARRAAEKKKAEEEAKKKAQKK